MRFVSVDLLIYFISVLKRVSSVYNKDYYYYKNKEYNLFLQYSSNLVQDLDLIILAGYYTKDKSLKKLNSLLMGAALPTNNKEEYPSSFEVILSVSNGLSKEEWNFLERQFSSKWLEECPANIINCSKVKILVLNCYKCTKLLNI